MKGLFSILLMLSPVVVTAEPSSAIAWRPELLEFVKEGNAAKGKTLAEPCSGCHGEKGISPIPGNPSLAGQLATYTYKQLRDYASGQRDHILMSSVAAGLSEQDSADLAVWFASLPSASVKNQSGSLEKAEVLVSKGNGKKIIPPCFTCHGRNGEGEKQNIPALAGQQAEYFARTLQEYKSGARHNDVYGRMRLIAEQLSDEDIQQLAQYYQQLKR